GGSGVGADHMTRYATGRCVLLVVPEGVAFIGDLDLGSFGPYYGDATSSLVEFRRTLARLPELPATAWVTSHHRGVYTEREAFLSALAAFAAKIEERSERDRKSTRLNSSHVKISYAVFCLKKKNNK